MLLRVLTLIVVLQLALASLKSDNEAKEIVIIDGRTYFFSYLTADIPAAMRMCEDLGMTLVSLETEAESLAVTSYISDILQNMTIYWTSGIHMVTDFTWSGSGKLFSYANWAPGQPDVTDFRTPACVVLLEGQLYDQDCHYTYSFICEDVCPLKKHLN